MKVADGDENENQNVYTLVTQLQKEKMLITNEKINIQKLNEEIKTKTESLIKSIWIKTKQRLYLLDQREFTILNYKHIKAIVNAEFVEAKKVLKFQSIVKIENLLQILRTQPEEFARWLFKGEQLPHDESIHFIQVLQSIVTGLYSSCLFSEDTNYMLKLLYELAKLQLLKSEEPRRMLKQSTCSFRNLYFIFNEVLPSAKIFLSAALEIPILRLLSYRELYLDIDPNKTSMRYWSDSHLQHEFKNLEDYRKETVEKLSEFAKGFIQSLRENVYTFPKSTAWIVFKISKIILKSFGAKEANAIVTELIFTLYVCPAIVDPEQYSISDFQITEVARHNLIQIAQILQVLALNKFETTDTRFDDIYNLFDKDIVSHFLDDVLFNLEHEDEPPVDITPAVSRDWVLFEEEELNNLVMLLQRVNELNHKGDPLKKADFSGNTSIETELNSLLLPSSLENSPNTTKSHTNGLTSDITPTCKKTNFLSIVKKTNSKQKQEDRPLYVIIFSIDKAIPEPVGLLSEEKVLKRSISEISKDVIIAEPANDNQGINEAVNNSIVVEAKQSYSNYHDEGSIGNTSDNLEGISEAASNHSVASSLEMENEDQNDNLSDMISANVSGRGTPNISGRDTPSSQVNDNEERPMPEVRQVDIVQPQPQISRQIRSEIDDKFCKFEIKKLLEGDETISIISETWSTDVLASDNETIDAVDSRVERMCLPMIEQAINEVPTGNILDISETQSESAWSTDVMASDTEHQQEVDNDDAGSVAQSDDTNSVARSDDTRSETDENFMASTRKLSNASSSIFQEYRKVEVKNERKTTQHIDNNANTVVFKSLTEMKTNYNANQVTARLQISSKDNAGPSGFNNNNNNVFGLIKKKNYDDSPNEILLSNCSLNSSSSGSSSNSFENNKHSQENCDQWESKQWLNSSGSSLNVTSTPSESTSELSVLSVNNLTMNPIRKMATVQVMNGSLNNTKNLKPSASTGAIPKSISFDMSADKGDKYLDDDQKNKRTGFFGKIKMGFSRSRSRGKSFRNPIDYPFDGNDDYLNKQSPNESPIKLNHSEVSEDILAKYRKPYMESNSSKNTSAKGRKIKNVLSEGEEMNINNSFDDIKKKLRIVLSNITSQTPKIITMKSLSTKSKIESILRLELGKTRKLKEWSNIARISEALRVINSHNESTCINLIESMQDDFVKRSSYVQYLIGSRQELLFCESFLDYLNKQIAHEKDQCDEYLSMICVRQFLNEQESRLLQFYDDFKDINLSDEKCDYLNKLYKQLYNIMQTSALWQDIFKNRCDTIKVTLERCIISKVYHQALYPNGDGDRHRDYVLFQHIEKLGNIITPNNKYLMIPKTYLRELPWIPAQDALNAMSAYRTPRDKVNCVVNCAKCIMDLLAFSQCSGARSADDFTPVLVYVIIKVNPANLLSTIQFVNSFYFNKLHGEEQYWWTQFCSAIEFIKTMDYSD